VTERLQVQIPELTRTAPRIQWLLDYSGQVALAGSQVWWSNDVRMVFQRLEFESVHKDYKKKRVTNSSAIPEPSTKNKLHMDSIKINDLMILSLHSKLVTNGQAFYWLSQLRHRWDEQQRQCLANICDVQFFYSYQYLENTPRLVITPSLAGQYLNLTLCSCPVQP
uniref:Uncharacterized protein n=1 Tax=Oncorhynchus tshawytscha TaxID=74940 RepID=A0A8C8GDR1_ONCTS